VRWLGGTAEALARPAAVIERIQSGGSPPVRVVLIQYDGDPKWTAGIEPLRANKSLRVFLMPTVNQRSEAEREVAVEGFAGTLTRPIKMGSLRATLSSALGGKVETVRPQRSEVTEEERAARGRFRILLVEDYELNRKLALRLIERAGYRVDCAENGQEAVQAAQSTDYDLILMDMQMPVMDGLEATGRIRELEQQQGGDRVPVIALTANVGEDIKNTCLNAGMDGYLTKPIRTEALYELLDKYLPSH
jgi:CheY-like chemotaxis protein